MSSNLSKVAIGVAVAAIAVLVQRRTIAVYEPTNMDGKTVLITGGTTGLGLESAKRLAKAGANIIVTARSSSKGEKAVQEIQTYSNHKSKVDYKILHLDDLESTKAAAQWDLPANSIDVLMLNAGVMGLPTLQKTSLGIEKQFHTNHLGHFVFTASMKPFLKPNARVVAVSSMGYLGAVTSGGLDLDYSWKPTEQNYSPIKSYAMSKLANIHFASKLNAISPYTAVSLHPGTVATDLARELTTIPILQKIVDATLMPLGQALGLLLSPPQGANVQLYLSSCSQDELVGGAYYNGYKPEKLLAFAMDTEKDDLLWKQSEELSGVVFNFEEN